MVANPIVLLNWNVCIQTPRSNTFCHILLEEEEDGGCNYQPGTYSNSKPYISEHTSSLQINKIVSCIEIG